MTDLLGMGSAWLERQRRRFMSREVIYRRGDVGLTVPATVGRTVFTVAAAGSGGSILERIESRDFLIATEDIVVLGLPQRGDRVMEVDGDQVHTHEVLAPGREPHWRWSDTNHTCYRIHTKHLSTTPATGDPP